jgi:adenylate cyclase
MSQFAAASRQVMASTFVGDAETEAEIAESILDGASALMPMVGPTLDYVYRLHLREQLRHVAFAPDEAGEGSAASVTTTVCFADLVGFTELGEELPPEELGRVTGRLEELAREVAHGPVRLVKLLGDAAMLVSPDTGAVVGSCLDLLEAMAAEEGFPLIRAGIARGPAVTRGGDFYGAPVNLASRITGVARPGSLLVSAEVRDEVPDDFRFSRAGSKHLKGISGSVELFRCRDLDDDGEKDEEKDQDDSENDEQEKSSSKRSRKRSRRH